MHQNAAALDDRRLGTQRKNIANLLASLYDSPFINKAIKRSVSYKLFEGYIPLLIELFNETLTEWKRRGFPNTMFEPVNQPLIKYPKWWDGPIHDQYKGMLYRADPIYYGAWSKFRTLPKVATKDFNE